MVVIDTDVMLLAFAFQNDQRQIANADFLRQIQTADPAITIYNLMELLGQLSFNFSSTHLDAWQIWLIEAYQLTVIWPAKPNDPITASFFRAEIFERPFAKMRAQRMAFMDALILNLTERTPDVTHFITWNARHFRDKSPLNVLTPAEYMAHMP